MDPREELAFLRFLNALEVRLQGITAVDRALKVGLRMAKEHFRADDAAIAVLAREPRGARLACAIPGEARFDLDELAAWLRGDRRAVPARALLARLERRGGNWGVLFLRRNERDFPKSSIRLLGVAAKKLSTAIARIDHERTAEVRSRLDQKILAQLRPQDLFYQLLD